MLRDLLAYSFDAAGPFRLFTFDPCLFTTYELAAPFFVLSTTAVPAHPPPQHWPSTADQCLVFIVLCGGPKPAAFEIRFDLQIWHFGCQPRHLWRLFICFSSMVEIFPTLYPYTRLDVVHEDWSMNVMLFGRKRALAPSRGKGWFGVKRVFTFLPLLYYIAVGLDDRYL